MKIAPYAKAVVGLLVAALTALGTALADGTVTPVEWVGVALAGLGTLGIVYAVPNRPKAAPQNPDGSYTVTSVPPAA